MTVLLLAGTAEAREISAGLAAAGIDHIASLAGATDRPAALSGRMRIGGFGGVDGLTAFLQSENVRAIIDATHPFAVRISRNAVAAAGKVPLLQVMRPAWPVNPRWTEVATLGDAAQALPTGSTAFLATGRGSLAHFEGREDVTFRVRVIDDRPGPCPLPNGRFLIGKPPFSIEEEMAVLKAEAITHLVARNSGGTGGAEKLIAAERLGLDVLIVARPNHPAADRVGTAAEALEWAAKLDLA